MIRTIESLKCFGIFQNFVDDGKLNPFQKFNLIYGWNGSGKSTLSKLFASLENKRIDEDFKDCEFRIKTDDGLITEKIATENNKSIKVFNQDFIRANIEWDKKVNTILLISEDKIDEKKKLDELKIKIKQAKENIGVQTGLQENLTKQISNFYTSSAKTIKESFKVIDTKDTYYFNYDKVKFEKFVKEYSEIVKDPKSLLTELEKEEIVKSIQPIEKNIISLAINKESYLKLTEARLNIEEIINKDVVAKTIDRLRNKPEINNWVNLGLRIHEEEESQNCEFCGQNLPEFRIHDLKNHFNESFKQITIEIDNALNWINTKLNNATTLPDSSFLYDEFQELYLLAKENMEGISSLLKLILLKWKEALEEKKKNPFINSLIEKDDLKKAVDNYNSIIDSIIVLVEKHNSKTLNFKEEVTSKKKRLELHYAAELVQNSELYQWNENLEIVAELLRTLKQQLIHLDEEEVRLESVLIDEAKGADKFNTYLHKFLGRSDISLKFNKELKGYNILRGNQKRIAKNLSEGEKTAIAFVYFVIKISEKGNDIEKMIVVVDDPISSFDSNHLFHAFSFLKLSCEKAKQLFVLTHNFQYFKLIRDWIIKKNKTEYVNGQKVEKIKSRIYTIESSTEEERSSFLNNAHETLEKYNSEYHYVFSKISNLKNEEVISLDKAYLVGNLCRKLLEGFLTFKFPRERNDFRALMDDCSDDKELIEKIYRFINKYSHNQLIEFYDTPIDNLVSEGNTIISDVFSLIESIDKVHYTEMQTLCN
jgi:wobble nucleotide-excising tRNase